MQIKTQLVKTTAGYQVLSWTHKGREHSLYIPRFDFRNMAAGQQIEIIKSHRDLSVSDYEATREANRRLSAENARLRDRLQNIKIMIEDEK